MWWCEDKLNWKTAHFRLPSVAQKRCMLKLTIKEIGNESGGYWWISIWFVSEGE